MNDIFKG